MHTHQLIPKAAFLVLIMFLSTAFMPRTAQNPACCTVSAVQEFADLAKDPDFRAAHEMPRLLTSDDYLKHGEFISFPTLDEQEGRAFVVRGKKSSRKVVFMIHEWWGLNQHIQQEAVAYQKELGNEVTVVALDLYDGKVAKTREEAAEYMQAVEVARARQIIYGAYSYFGKNADIATIGWCFGGGWSLQTAILLGEQAKACVIYYGMPEKDVAALKRLDAPVLGIFAKQDKWITPQVVRTFEEQLKELNHPVETHLYDADHAFANPTGARYNEAAAQDARQKTLDFLKDKLAI